MGNGLDMDLAGPRAGRPGHSRLRRDAVGAGRPVSAPREFFDSAANSRRALRAWGDRRGRVPTPTLRVAVTGTPISRRRALALITLGGASLAAGAAGWVAGLGPPGHGARQPQRRAAGATDRRCGRVAGGPPHHGAGIQRYLAGPDPAG